MAALFIQGNLIMKSLKLSLAAATALTVFSANAAQAQVQLPNAEIRGAGASSITNVLVRSLNCVGNPGNHVAGDTANNRLNKAGNNSGQLSTIAPGAYAGTPAYDCETQEIQPGFQGKYVATGSGTGRAFWRTFSNQLPGTTGSNINPFGTWNNVQFAMSDAPASASDITTYNANANNSTNKAGAPIHFPLYVLPVAIAYEPRYGRTAGGVDLLFRVKVPVSINGQAAGGLRLSREAYCGIFNGDITNWNDPLLQSLNGDLSFRSTSDNLTRWNTEGVPIRLVGRIDRSGTTDVWTRHLVQACNGFGYTNAYVSANETLPHDGTINMTSKRTDTNVKPGNTGAGNGSVTLVSGAFYNRVNNTIETDLGVEQAGKYLLADGGSGVRDAIRLAPDRPSTVNSTLLNGKVGYIGADNVIPAPGATLFSAALGEGPTSTRFLMPTARNATLSFGSGAAAILPPQSNATGAYDENDTRTNSITGQPVNRANPLDWTDVLYSAQNGAQRLDNPVIGYPITGTAQFLTYTCFATVARRLALVEFLALNTGNVGLDSNRQAIDRGIFNSTVAVRPGILAQAGVAPMPKTWLAAFNQTFLRDSTQSSNGTVLGSRNLWIQSKLPSTTAQFNPNNAKGAFPNPTCTSGSGA